jgi:branched-chain amino acid transport system substrate-binding protein
LNGCHLRRVVESKSWSIYSLNTYAAIQVIAEGIRRAGTDFIKVAATLRLTPIATVIGQLSYDTNGDNVNPDFVIYHWHDGEYAAIYK